MLEEDEEALTSLLTPAAIAGSAPKLPTSNSSSMAIALFKTCRRPFVPVARVGDLVTGNFADIRGSHGFVADFISDVTGKSAYWNLGFTDPLWSVLQILTNWQHMERNVKQGRWSRILMS